jgi:hypothetical protein
MFLSGDDELRSWRVGPRPDLVGTPLADLPAGEPSGASAEVDRAAELATVDSEAGRLPALLTGTAEAAPDGEQTVVWALDGRIAAVTPTYVDGDRPHALAALLPEPMLGNGAHVLALYLLGDGDRLAPVRIG